MPIKSKEYLKSRFENGDIPDEIDFSDLIDAIFYAQWPEDGRFDVIDAVDVDYSSHGYETQTNNISGHLQGINDKFLINYYSPPDGNESSTFFLTPDLPNELNINMSSNMTIDFNRAHFNTNDAVFGVLYIKTNGHTLSANFDNIKDWFVVFESFDPNEYETIVYHSGPGKPYAEIR